MRASLANLCPPGRTQRLAHLPKLLGHQPNLSVDADGAACVGVCSWRNAARFLAPLGDIRTDQKSRSVPPVVALSLLT
jgi:hypothetical protein